MSKQEVFPASDLDVNILVSAQNKLESIKSILEMNNQELIKTQSIISDYMGPIAEKLGFDISKYYLNEKTRQFEPIPETVIKPYQPTNFILTEHAPLPSGD